MTPREALGAVGEGLRGWRRLSGRMARPAFAAFALFVIVALALANILDRKLGLAGLFGEGAPGPLLALALVGLLPALLTAAWRRMQDTGWPGWVTLIPWPVLALANLKGLGLAVLTGGAESPIAGLIAFLPRALTLLSAGFVLVRLGLPSRAEETRHGPEPQP